MSNEGRSIESLVRNAKYYPTTTTSTLKRPERSTRSPFDPPEHYVCFRCNQKGHYKKFCPTLGDTRFDPKKPLVTLRGLPQWMFLNTAVDGDDTNVFLHNGKRVKWNHKALNDRFVQELHPHRGHVRPLVPNHLQCPCCTRLLDDAVAVLCCGASFCKSCVLDTYMTHNPRCLDCDAPWPSSFFKHSRHYIQNPRVRQCVRTWRKRQWGGERSDESSSDEPCLSDME